MAITVEDVEVRKEDACFKFKPDESTRTLSPDSEGRNLIPRKYPINIGFRFIECGSLGFQSNMVAANGFLSVVASLPKIFTICSTMFP